MDFRLPILVAASLVCNAQAATIYFCEAYSGGTFLSNSACSVQKAVMRDSFQVPSTMSFDQQTDLVKQQLAQRNAASTQQPAQSRNESNATRCAALHKERLEIESFDTKMQWRPIEEVNKAQQRMRGLRAEMAQRGCPMQ